jgi:hypothetical protein
MVEPGSGATGTGPHSSSWAVQAYQVMVTIGMYAVIRLWCMTEASFWAKISHLSLLFQRPQWFLRNRNLNTLNS